MKVYVDKIHPARSPDHCVLSGVREGGELGFWAGPDIDVPNQIVTPHVSRRMAKQWLEADGLVVDAVDHLRVQEALDAEHTARLEAEAAVKQLKARLGRVYPGRKRRTAKPKQAVTA